ncbi:MULTISPECIES: hypothetical protein [unclassified Wolbachia]
MLAAKRYRDGMTVRGGMTRKEQQDDASPCHSSAWHISVRTLL